MAFAEGVRPEILAACPPMPRRLAAVFNSALSVSELEVYVVIVGNPARAGTDDYNRSIVVEARFDYTEPVLSGGAGKRGQSPFSRYCHAPRKRWLSP
jgi:hypothetical protein